MEPVKVYIPAVHYDAALAFCNERRHDAGLPPWTALPAGNRGRADQCPCGQAVPGLRVYEDSYAVGYNPVYGHDIKEFIHLFDGTVCMTADNPEFGQLALPVRMSESEIE